MRYVRAFNSLLRKMQYIFIKYMLLLNIYLHFIRKRIIKDFIFFSKWSIHKIFKKCNHRAKWGKERRYRIAPSTNSTELPKIFYSGHSPPSRGWKVKHAWSRRSCSLLSLLCNLSACAQITSPPETCSILQSTAITFSALLSQGLGAFVSQRGSYLPH